MAKMRILYLLFLYLFLVSAEEDAKPESREDNTEDYSSIELTPTPGYKAEEKSGKVDRDEGSIDIDDVINKSEFNSMYNMENTQALRDSTGDDVYKTAKLNIEAKKASEENEKEDRSAPKESTVENKSDNQSKTAQETDKSGVETKTTTENEQETRRSKESSKNAVENETAINEEKTAVETKSEEDKTSTSDISDKKDIESLDESQMLRTVAELEKTIDDMDDLIYPYELEKYRRRYDDDDYDKTLNDNTPSSSEDFTGITFEGRPNRRMFDSVPILDAKGKSEHNDLNLESTFSFTTPSPFKGSELSSPLSNVVQSPQANIMPYHSPRPFIRNFGTPLNNVNEQIPNWNRPIYQTESLPNRRNTQINGIPSGLNTFDKSQGVFGPHSGVMPNQNLANQWREMRNRPTDWNSQAVYGPTRRRYPQDEHSGPTQRFLLPKQYTPEWNSQEIEEPLHYRFEPLEESSDSNAYPYVSPAKIEADANGIFTKLARASHQQIPQFSQPIHHQLDLGNSQMQTPQFQHQFPNFQQFRNSQHPGNPQVPQNQARAKNLQHTTNIQYPQYLQYPQNIQNLQIQYSKMAPIPQIFQYQHNPQFSPQFPRNLPSSFFQDVYRYPNFYRPLDSQLYYNFQRNLNHNVLFPRPRRFSEGFDLYHSCCS